MFNRYGGDCGADSDAEFDGESIIIVMQEFRRYVLSIQRSLVFQI